VGALQKIVIFLGKSSNFCGALFIVIESGLCYTLYENFFGGEEKK